MGILSFLFLVINMLVVLGLCLFNFYFSITMGFIGLGIFVIWLIAYAVSVEAIIAPRDFWVNSSLKVTLKKLQWANTVAFACFVIVIIIFLVMGNQAVIEWNDCFGN